MGVLIETDELAVALATDRPPVLADVRWNLGGPPGVGEFEAGHIPRAQWVDLEHELSGPAHGRGGRHPLPTAQVFEHAMRRIGVCGDLPVVVCDAASSLAASWLWWLLTDAGHRSVRVLNGGVAGWRQAGLPVQLGPAEAAATGDFVSRPGQRHLVLGDDVVSTLARPEPAVVVDVRAAERFSGAAEPIDPVGGHIPGAINLPSMLNLDPNGRFLEPSVLAARFVAAGVDESAVVYCGSGITAAHTLLALNQAGIPDAYLYAGSWSDWISDPVRPVETGGHALG